MPPSPVPDDEPPQPAIPPGTITPTTSQRPNKCVEFMMGSTLIVIITTRIRKHPNKTGNSIHSVPRGADDNRLPLHVSLGLPGPERSVNTLAHAPEDSRPISAHERVDRLRVRRAPRQRHPCRHGTSNLPVRRQPIHSRAGAPSVGAAVRALQQGRATDRSGPPLQGGRRGRAEQLESRWRGGSGVIGGSQRGHRLLARCLAPHRLAALRGTGEAAGARNAGTPSHLSAPSPRTGPGSGRRYRVELAVVGRDAQGSGRCHQGGGPAGLLARLCRCAPGNPAGTRLGAGSGEAAGCATAQHGVGDLAGLVRRRRSPRHRAAIRGP